MIHKSAGGIGDKTLFEFQYLPRIGMLTELGQPEEHQQSDAGAAGPLMLMTRRATQLGTRALTVAGATLVGVVAVAGLARCVGVMGVGVEGWLRMMPRYVFTLQSSG